MKDITFKLTSDEIKLIKNLERHGIYIMTYVAEAERQCNKYINKKQIKLKTPLDETDYIWLAEKFYNQHRTDVADDIQWDIIVSIYIKECQIVD